MSSLHVYTANRDLNNRLSELKAFTFYTLENQYGLWLDHTRCTPIRNEVVLLRPGPLPALPAVLLRHW